MMWIDPTGEEVVSVTVVYASGVAVVTTAAWLASPEGQQAIADGATVIYQGFVVIGEAIGEFTESQIELFQRNIYLAFNQNKTVSDILKTKKGSIKNAPLPSGSPGWSEIMTLTLD